MTVRANNNSNWFSESLEIGLSDDVFKIKDNQRLLKNTIFTDSVWMSWVHDSIPFSIHLQKWLLLSHMTRMELNINHMTSHMSGWALTSSRLWPCVSCPHRTVCSGTPHWPWIQSAHTLSWPCPLAPATALSRWSCVCMCVGVCECGVTYWTCVRGYSCVWEMILLL